VATHLQDFLPPDCVIAPEVRVTCDPHGGWRVDAIRAGRVVASRHCHDWHRVESVRDELASELEVAEAPVPAHTR
jgi:hypothetical protein